MHRIGVSISDALEICNFNDKTYNCTGVFTTPDQLSLENNLD